MSAAVAVFVLVFSLLGGVNLYLSYRVHQCLREVVPQFSMGYSIAFFFLMALVMICGFARSMLPIPSSVRNVLGIVSSWWMGIFVYLLLYILLSDTLYIILKCFFPGSHLRAALVLAAVVCALGISAYGVWHAGDIRSVSYDVTLASGDQGKRTKLVMISDLHLGAVGSEKRLAKIVRSINAQQPDIICIAGDFFDNDFYAIREPEKAVEALKELQAAHGIYMCSGNHDSGKTVPEMLRFLDACDIRLLADEYVVIDERFVLAGRLDASPIGGFDGRRRAALDSVLSGAPEGLPVIVMDHNPAAASSYGAGVSLVLSGHTHRGQIFPGSLFTDRMFDVDYGCWQKDASSPRVIVSSGVGTWGMPMRVGTDCEIVAINLYH